MAYKMKEERVLHNAVEFCIRKAKLSEEDEIDEMFGKYLHAHRVGLPGSIALVAIDKKTGNIIGVVERVANIKEHFAHGVGLIVDAEFHKRGIGTALVKAMDNELKNMGIKHVTTIATSEGAWKILRENGYEHSAETKAYLKENGLPEDKFVEAVQMVKEL
jgi:N-acetylglutamate synthase-like GNAT family acetyltransferase